MFSDPVVGEQFFGRQPIIDLLTKRATALKSGYRQNVAIIGHQQVGKTSILRHFLHVTKDPSVLSVYVEIKLQNLDYFIEQFVRALLYQFLSQEEKVDASEPLERLAERSMSRLPQTVARIGEILALLKQRHSEEAYSRLFELTSVVSRESGKHCIVILDEFHRLGEFGVKNAFVNFGKRIMLQKETMYVLSSSSFSASKKILAEKLALLFGNFERIYLEPFDFETSFGFIDKKIEPRSMPDPLKDFLVSFTDGHPFFLETITSRIRELAAAKQEQQISRRTVAEVLVRLLYESQGVFYQYFYKLISPWMRTDSRGSHVLILTELAKGKNKLKDLAAAVNRSQRETSQQIKELMAHELIVKTGVFFRFHNKIFKFWLREVYEKKELSLLGAAASASDFRAHIERVIAEHEELLGMDYTDRVLSLFKQFKNDIIEIGEKKRKLPHFTEFIEAQVEGVPDTDARSIIARGNGRCWVCKIVHEKVTEREILDLVGSVDKRKAPVHTKVLVALNGLEENAKLLAKEKRILTLGLARINMLMDIYGKSPIIHGAFHSRPLPAETA